MIAISVVFALIGVVLAWHFGEGIIVISTSIIGSYLFMKGLADFLGNYPDVSTIYADMTEKNWDDLEHQFTQWFWVYFTIFVVSVFVCIWYQRRNLTDVDDEMKKQNTD